MEAIAFARQLGGPVVVKADGLAAGKGDHLLECRGGGGSNRRHASKGPLSARPVKVVVEEFLEGEEVSFCALRRSALPMASAQDHKRASTAIMDRTQAAWAPTRRRRS